MRFGRKGSKAVLLSALLFKYTYGSAGPKYSHSRGHSDKLQIVDLLYLWQLIYVRINKAMCSLILFNSPGFQFYFKCLLTLLYKRKSERIMPTVHNQNSGLFDSCYVIYS